MKKQEPAFEKGDTGYEPKFYSGMRCYVQPCEEPAGTWWGPYYCKKHDIERRDRITKNLEEIVASMERRGGGRRD